MFLHPGVFPITIPPPSPAPVTCPVFLSCGLHSPIGKQKTFKGVRGSSNLYILEMKEQKLYIVISIFRQGH